MVALMSEQYKLTMETYVNLTTRKRLTVTRTFVWQDKDDALACKALLERARLPHQGITHISFSAFTEETPL
jgi:hypothetical protein